MNCNYYNGKCVFLNGKEDGCIACPIKGAYNKGVRDTKKDYERPTGEWQLHGMIYYCSKCGHECGESGDNFCGNCGADLRGGAGNDK